MFKVIGMMGGLVQACPKCGAYFGSGCPECTEAAIQAERTAHLDAFEYANQQIQETP